MIAGRNPRGDQGAPRRRRRWRDRIGQEYAIAQNLLGGWSGEAGRIAVTQPRRVRRSFHRSARGRRTQGDLRPRCRLQNPLPRSDRARDLYQGDDRRHPAGRDPGDPDLLEYDTIIVDEAHERSLNIDFLLGYLRLLRRKRPDLKIVITSATIDTETFSKAFGDAPVIEVSGRMFPVEVRYWPLDEILQDRGDYTYLMRPPAR